MSQVALSGDALDFIMGVGGGDVCQPTTLLTHLKKNTIQDGAELRGTIKRFSIILANKQNKAMISWHQLHQLATLKTFEIEAVSSESQFAVTCNKKPKNKQYL